MCFWSNEELNNFHKKDFRSIDQLKKSGLVGCFYCGMIYPFSFIEECIESESTAICPLCGIDAVIPLGDFPECKQAQLLDQMYEKYFSSDGIKLGDLMKKNFYLYQRKDGFQWDVFHEMEEILDQSGRRIQKARYGNNQNLQSYSIPIFDEEIIIYPLSQQFIEVIVPSFYPMNEFSIEKQESLKEIIKHGPSASFIIEMPRILKDDEAEHVIKLLGMAFGGYFARIDKLPADGVLTKKDHIYIKKMKNKKINILANLELLLEKYGSS